MPYTLSHPAIVLPFARVLRRLRLLSATVIGSMVPDFGYLLPFHLTRLQTHGIAPLATFCLPVGLLSYWIFQRLIKTPMFNLLPDGAYRRWLPFAAPANPGNPRHWLLAAAGVLAGAVTHLAWDDFTHEYARGMRMLPELQDWRLELHGHFLTGARVLQDGSSLLALPLVLVLCAWALRGDHHTAPAARALNTTERRAWVLAGIAAAMVFSVGFSVLGNAGETFHLSTLSLYAAIGILRGLTLAAICISLALNLRLHTKL